MSILSFVRKLLDKKFLKQRHNLLTLEQIISVPFQLLRFLSPLPLANDQFINKRKRR